MTETVWFFIAYILTTGTIGSTSMQEIGPFESLEQCQAAYPAFIGKRVVTTGCYERVVFVENGPGH
jgi:hypothetical protein